MTAVRVDGIVPLVAVLTRAVAIVAGASWVAAIVAGVVQTRGLWAPGVLSPSLRRIDPGRGLDRLGSADTLLAMAGCGLRLAILAALTADVLIRHAGDIARMAELTPDSRGIATAMTAAATLVGLLVVRVAAALLVFGLLDAAWQRYRVWRELLMTRDEKRREQRDSEGSPHFKAYQRRIHGQILAHIGSRNEREGHRDQPAAPRLGRACVAIVGHGVAVALAHDPTTMATPHIVLSAAGFRARQMARLAADSPAVAVHWNDALARQLGRLPRGAAVPTRLHEPVARVLAASPKPG